MTNKLTGKIIYERVQLTKYISAPMTLRNGTSGLSNYSPFHKDEMSLFFKSSEQTTIRELKECALLK